MLCNSLIKPGHFSVDMGVLGFSSDIKWQEQVSFDKMIMIPSFLLYQHNALMSLNLDTKSLL